MTQTMLNILDLGQVSPKKADAGQFGLLESLGQSDVSNIEQQGPSFDMIFGNMLASIAPELNGQNLTLSQNLETSENLVTFENQILSQLLSESQSKIMEQVKVPENIQMFNKELQDIIPQGKLLQNINIQEILSQQNVELENGQFKVISQEVENSKLSLKIENSNGKQISILLPIDSLQDANNIQQRVSLESSYYRNEIKSLIEKVDIRQIEIKSVETNSLQKALQPVEISLLGENNAATVALKASLKRNQIKIVDNSPISNSKAAVLDESGIWGDKVVRNNNHAEKLIENLSPKMNQQFGFSTQKAIQPMVLNDTAMNQSFQQVDSIFNTYNSESVDAGELEKNIENVRMQLPENIKSVLRPNGQLLVIKMNPENLGPAKLSLSFSDDKLHAKLVVSSLNAKHALEGSMHRLVDQLHKANILVDKIDVTLDENKNQNEQFNQRQQWQRKMSYKNINLEQLDQNEFEQSVQKPMRSSILSISSNGVNYLA